jgi:hypothetical protein
VLLVWRGGERFARALESIRLAEHFFSRIVVSITSRADSADVALAHQYLYDSKSRGLPSKIEIICTGQELPTMRHQAFWINYLYSTGAQDSDWIFWLAYDDEISARGIERILAENGGWPLEPRHTYFGPWAVRHESADFLWQGDRDLDSEIWTALPLESSESVTPTEWLCSQLKRPTYIQMSGSLSQLSCHQRLVKHWPRKTGPMRIELATALDHRNQVVTQFQFPTTIIYGRPDSDRSKYSHDTRRQDWHLMLVATKWCILNPQFLWRFPRVIWTALYSWNLNRRGLAPREEWRVFSRFKA